MPDILYWWTFQHLLHSHKHRSAQRQQHDLYKEHQREEQPEIPVLCFVTQDVHAQHAAKTAKAGTGKCARKTTSLLLLAVLGLLTLWTIWDVATSI